MSGKLGTGLNTRIIQNCEKIEKYFDLKIKDINIRIITLSVNKHFHRLKIFGKYLQDFITPKISPTLSHLAIQLNMENDKDIFILEYGPYFPVNYIHEESSGILNCFKSIGKRLEQNNKTPYWFINIDGVRLSKINYEKLFYANDPSKYPKNVVKVAINDAIEDHFFGDNDDYEDMDKFRKKFKDGFKSVECDIKNKITLGELYNYFKGDKWTAEKYVIGFHDCQNFASEVVYKLKAIRKYEHDQLRIREKKLLPDCVIRELKRNEELSALNIMGSIPIIGLIFDYGYKIRYNISKSYN